MAAHAESARPKRGCCNITALAFNRASETNLPLGLVQKHHQFRRGEQLALTHAGQVRRNLTESFWGSRDDGAEHRAHEVLGLGRAVED